MAYEIYETNINEKEVILAGIQQNGFVFAQKLKDMLTEISPLEVTLCAVVMNKKKPLELVETSLPASAYKNKPLV